jgi:hypothetical protein
MNSRQNVVVIICSFAIPSLGLISNIETAGLPSSAAGAAGFKNSVLPHGRSDPVILLQLLHAHLDVINRIYMLLVRKTLTGFCGACHTSAQPGGPRRSKLTSKGKLRL